MTLNVFSHCQDAAVLHLGVTLELQTGLVVQYWEIFVLELTVPLLFDNIDKLQESSYILNILGVYPVTDL